MHPPTRRITIALLSFSALVLAVATSPAPASEVDPARFAEAISAFEAWDAKNTPVLGGVLFVGSSSIRMWPTARDFPDLPVVNRGFGGAHVSDVNTFRERVVAPYTPRIIVFYCGDNDIKAGKTPQRVLADFADFVGYVHRTLPDTQIIYLPIKPSVSRWEWWDPMQEVNAGVRAVSDVDPGLHYADVATPMLAPDGGMPPADLFIEDGLHLSAKGYRIWNGILGAALEGLGAQP